MPTRLRLVSLALSCLCALSTVAAHAAGAVPPVQQTSPADPGPIIFASTAVGGGTNTVNVQLLLNQSGAVTISAAASANGHQEFTVGTITGCTADGSTVVAAGTTCTVPVTFAPYYPGQRSLPLAVTLGGQVYSFGMTGLATGPLARIDPTYLLTLTGQAGTTSTTPSPDNVPYTSGILYEPYGIFADAANNVYIDDNAHYRIRLVYESANPQLACLIITEAPTLFGLAAGSNTCAGATSQPTVGDIYTVAGSGTSGYTADNVLATTSAIEAQSVFADAAGNIYIPDETSRVRVVYQGGANLSCLIVIENPTMFGLAAGATSCAGATSLPTPGFIYTIAGTGTAGETGDSGIATSAKIINPSDLFVDAAGDVYFTNYSASTSTPNGHLRIIYNGGALAAQLITVENPTVTTPVIGDVYTIGGSTSTEGGDGTLATSGSVGILCSYGIRVDAYGNVFFSDKTYSTGVPLATARVRVIYNGTAGNPNPVANLIALENPGTTAQPGYVYTIAGSSGTTASAPVVDGVLATASQLSGPYQIGLDPAGDILIADRFNYTVRRVSAATGLITTIAGQPAATQTIASGLAIGGAGRLWSPWGLALDSAGGMYIGDEGANRIRILESTSSSTYPLTVPPVTAGSTGGVVSFIETNTGTPGSTLTLTTDTAASPFGFLSPASWAGVSECAPASTTTLTVPSIISDVNLASGASCSIGIGAAPLNAGTVDATALSVSDNSLNLSTSSQTLYATVTATGVLTTLTSNPTAITAGNPTQLIATLVNGTTPVTSGTVDFSITGGASLGSATLDAVAGTATITTSALTAPSTSITTVYAGDTSANPLFTPSTAVTVLTVSSKPATAITVTANPTAINAGQSTTLTAAVSSPTAGTITGTVTFTDATSTPNVTLGTVMLDTGTETASLPTTALASGTRTIEASYSGDATYAGSATTVSATVVVTALPTTTAVTASPNPANIGTSVTLTGTVSAAAMTAGPYSGSMTFKDTYSIGGGTPVTATYGPVAVDPATGVANYSTTTLAAATHSITATYASDPFYGTSTSATPVSVAIIAPSFVVNITNANGTAVTTPGTTSAGIAVTQGLNGTVTFSVQAVGGYTGTVTPVCNLAGLPAGITCLYAPANFVFTSNSTSTETLSITTQKINAANRTAGPILAVLLLPGAGLALFGLRRRRALKPWQRLALLCLLFAGSALAVGGLSGCGNGLNLTASPLGTYQVPVNFSDGTTTLPFAITVTVVGTSSQ